MDFQPSDGTILPKPDLGKVPLSDSPAWHIDLSLQKYIRVTATAKTYLDELGIEVEAAPSSHEYVVQKGAEKGDAYFVSVDKLIKKSHFSKETIHENLRKDHFNDLLRSRVESLHREKAVSAQIKQSLERIDGALQDSNIQFQPIDPWLFSTMFKSLNLDNTEFKTTLMATAELLKSRYLDTHRDQVDLERPLEFVALAAAVMMLLPDVSDMTAVFAPLRHEMGEKDSPERNLEFLETVDTFISYFGQDFKPDPREARGELVQFYAYHPHTISTNLPILTELFNDPNPLSRLTDKQKIAFLTNGVRNPIYLEQYLDSLIAIRATCQEKVPDEVIARVLQHTTYNTFLTLLPKLTKVFKIDLQNRLSEAINSKDMHLAALLVHLGADPRNCPQIKDERIIQGLELYAFQLKQAVGAEKRFRELLHIRTFGNFAGDALLREKVDDSGKKLEGMQKVDGLLFINAALEYFIEKNDRPLSKANLESFQRALEELKKAAKTAQMLELFKDNDDLEGAAKFFQEHVEQLKSGETFLMPFGWNDAAGGHAMLVEARLLPNKQVLLTTFNTGDGVTFQGIQREEKLMASTFKVYQLPLAEMKKGEHFKLLVEPMIKGGKLNRQGGKYNYTINDIQNVLLPYAVPKEEQNRLLVRHGHYALLENWMKAQLSGTCTIRVLLAYIRAIVGPDLYRQFKPFIKREGARILVEENGSLLQFQKALRSILSQVVPNAYRRLVKQREAATAELLEQIQQLQVKFERAAGPAELTVNRTTVPDLSSQRQKILESKNRLNPITTGKTNLAHTIFNTNEWPTIPVSTKPEDWIKYLNDTLSYASTNQVNNEAIVDSLRLLLHQTQNPQSPWNLMLASVNQKHMNDLCLAFNEMCKEIYTFRAINLTTNPATKMAHYSALALSREVIAAYEQNTNVSFDLRMSTLPIDSTDLETAFQNYPIASGQVLQDMQILRAKLKGGMVTNAKLFEWKKYGVFEPKKQPCLCFPAGGPEIVYADRWASKMPEQMQIRMYRELSAVQRRTAGNFNQDQWKMVWMLANDQLPIQFFYLFRIAVMARIEHPGIDLPGSGLDEENELFSHVYGPFITEGNEKGVKEVNFSMNSAGKFDGVFKQLLRPSFDQEVAPNYLPGDHGKFIDGIPQKFKEQLIRFRQNSPISNPVLIDYPFYIRGIGLKENELVLLTTPSMARMLGGLVTAERGRSIPLQILIQNFRDFSLFKQPENRAYFFRSLYTDPEEVIRAFKSQPSLLQDLQRLFAEAIMHYEGTTAVNSDEDSEWHAFLFLIENQMNILDILEKNAQVNVSAMADAIYLKLRAMLDLPAIKRKPQLTQLIQALMLSTYRFKNEGGKVRDPLQAALHAAAFRHLHSTLPENSALSPQLQICVGTVMTPLLPEIYKTLNNDPTVRTKFFQDIGAIYQITLPIQAQWSLRGPVFAATVNQTDYQFDFLTGALLVNLAGSLNSNDFKKDPNYMAVFGNKVLHGFGNTNHFEAEDEISPIAFEYVSGGNLEHQIFRQLKTPFSANKEWAMYVGASNPLTQTIPNFDPLQAWWVNHPDQPNLNTIVYLNPKDGAIERWIDHEGYIHFKDHPEVQYEWMDTLGLPDDSFITTFSSHSILLRNRMKPTEMILEFPGYEDVQKRPVRFKGELNLASNREDWYAMSQPDWKVASDQALSFVSGFRHYIILEHQNGQKAALIPYSDTASLNKPAAETSEELASVEETATHKHIQVLTIPIQNETLRLRDPSQNIFLAYEALMHATRPENYAAALSYLQKGYKFEQFSPEDYRILGWIFTSISTNKDTSVFADTIRLYAAWLVHDNVRRNGYPELTTVEGEWKKNKKKHPDFMSDPLEWQTYWFKAKDKPSDLKRFLTTPLAQELDELSLDYLGKRNNLPAAMRLENVLSQDALLEWNPILIGKIMPGKPVTAVMMPSAKWEHEPITYMPTLHEEMFSNKKTEFTAQLRIEPKLFANQFFMLISELFQGSPARKLHIMQIINTMRYDPDPNNFKYRLILQAIFLMFSNFPKDKPVIQIIETLQKIAEITAQGATLSQVQTVFNTLTAPLEEFRNSLYGMKIKVSEPAFSVQEATLPPLPRTIPAGRLLSLTVIDAGFNPTRSIYKRHFKAGLKSEPVLIEKFHAPSSDPYVQERFKELQNDYVAGCQKNISRVEHRPALSINQDQIVNAVEDELSQLNVRDALKLEALQRVILSRINALPSDQMEALLQTAKLAAGQARSLTIDDCRALFLMADESQYKKITPLKELKEIQTLHNLIGQYLLLSNQVAHQNRLLKMVDEYRVAESNEKEKVFQSLAEGLNTQQAVNPETDHPALLVFEEAAGVYLRTEQVQLLREAVVEGKLQNLLLQLIQGGGKSFVFGHILALLKADGYHLSVHIPATSQFGSVVKDMSHLSGKLFGQRERSFTFDDEPFRFTPDYLNNLRNTLHMAILNREYVTVTKESLRAMRSKYLKTREELRTLKLNEPESTKIPSLEASNAILKDILKLFVERGLFTFDEAHLAFNPYEELNMPTGALRSVDTGRSKVIAQVLHELITLTKSVKISPEQFETSRNQLVERLLQNRTFVDMLTHDIPQHAQAAIAYIRGADVVLPEALSAQKAMDVAQGKPSAVDLIVIARMLLKERWLLDQLAKKLNEKHGFPLDQQAIRISIPYLANMTPAENAEFSDQIVMLINTFIGYAALGLTDAQLKDFIAFYRDKALGQLQHAQLDRRLMTFQSTPAYVEFKNLTGMALDLVNLENRTEMDSLKGRLHSGQPESIAALFDYAITREIAKVKFFEYQVSTNSDNTVSMAKGSIAYSGSVPNPNVVPVGMTLKADVGTNGQTIDLLIRKNDDVWVVKSDPQSLFNDLIERHPHRDKIHSIIDSGDHFNGIPNVKAAEMICRSLKKMSSPIEKVVYFDQGNLCWMEVNHPKNTGIFSDTLAATIEVEAGVPESKLFYYYDHFHITGYDFRLPWNAYGVLTSSEETMFTEIGQGGRRHRLLDHHQHLIEAMTDRSVVKMNQQLNASWPTEIGKAAIPVKELVAFTYLNEVQKQQDENLVIGLHKLFNLIQAQALKALYQTPNATTEDALYEQVRLLFVRKTEIDIVAAYASQNMTIPMRDFLIGLRDHLLNTFTFLSHDQKQAMINETERLIQKILPGLKPTHEVSQGSQTNPLGAALVGREGTQIRVQQSHVHAERLSQMEALNRGKERVVFPESELPLEMNPQKPPLAQFDPSEMESLVSLCPIAVDITPAYPQLFSKSLYMTERFMLTNKNASFLTAPKRSQFFLMVRTRAPEGDHWNLELVTVREAEFIRRIARAYPQSKQNTDFMLVNREGKLDSASISGKTVAANLPQELGSPAPVSLIVQALFFNGDLKALDQTIYREAFEEWLKVGNNRKMARQFFEQEIPDKQAGYSGSRSYQLLYRNI